MPANGRGGSLKADFTESATENIPPVLGASSASVRVKRCGKSAPRAEQSVWQGKPHAEQDQIGEEERPAPLRLPGRLLEPGSNAWPRGMTAALRGTETGLQSGRPNRKRRIVRAGAGRLQARREVKRAAPAFFAFHPNAAVHHLDQSGWRWSNRDQCRQIAG